MLPVASNDMFLTALVYRYVQSIDHQSDFLSFCQQYNLNHQNQLSKVIYAHSWIQNNIEILMYQRLYQKDCLMELTDQEMSDFYQNYSIFVEDFIPDRHSLNVTTSGMLNHLSLNQRLELMNMNMN